MQQTWANLFFQHWEVDESMLQSHLPNGLTVDTFRGKAYLGICGLSMKSVRPQGLPALPWLSNFAELNVRTYVLWRAGLFRGAWIKMVCGDWMRGGGMVRRMGGVLIRGSSRSTAEKLPRINSACSTG